MWKQPVCSQPERHGGWNGVWKIWGRCCINIWAGNFHFEGLTQAAKAKRRWVTTLTPVSCPYPALLSLRHCSSWGRTTTSEYTRSTGAFNLKQELQLMARHSQKIMGTRESRMIQLKSEVVHLCEQIYHFSLHRRPADRQQKSSAVAEAPLNILGLIKFQVQMLSAVSLQTTCC